MKKLRSFAAIVAASLTLASCGLLGSSGNTTSTTSSDVLQQAGTDILGMIPLMTSPFWAPMAVAIAVGLIIATFLTLLVLPVMYAVAYRAEEA